MTLRPDTAKRPNDETDQRRNEVRENELTDVLDGADAAFEKVQGDRDRQPSKPGGGRV